MSQRSKLLRFDLIIKRVQKKACTLREMDEYLQRQSELQGYELNMSPRTFKRDLDDIRSMFNVDIQYDHSRRVYDIVESDDNNNTSRLLEAFNTFNILNVTEGLSRYIHFEKRKPQGTEHLYGLLHAVKNKFVVKFDYYKYWDDEHSHRSVAPYALKEARGRWYLLATDMNGGILKTFGLDRMSELEITRQRYKPNKAPDVETLFRDYFGIINPEQEKAVRIVLSFSAEQGRYVRSYPLHQSQKVIAEKDNELRIELFLAPTYDLIMELMSFGAEVKVLEPKGLVKDITTRFKAALALY